MYVRNPDDLAAVAKDKRLALGWSQKLLAEKVGVRRLWIIDFERGKPTVELRLVLRTLEALNLHIFIEEEGAEAKENGEIGENGPEIDLNEILSGNPDDDEL